MFRKTRLPILCAGAPSSSSAASPPTPSCPSAAAASTKRPMLSDQRRAKLESVYSLVGTHSAVKLCRWQKADLRGHAGCYKYTFYNIASARCMESSPNMGCANRCIFCWRGNTHPLIKDKNAVPDVGGAQQKQNGEDLLPQEDEEPAPLSEWNFQTDEPVELVDKMIEQHKRLVWECRNLPGATKEKVELAMQPCHNALSLIGEPISYPRINEFCAELHRRNISTFLVNNGQFPVHLRALTPVTQLYVSIDATTPDMMTKLDRPVHKDFWARHEASIAILAERKERTVFRMTCIDERGAQNGLGNMSDADIERLVEHVRRAGPNLGLIELKAMTPAFQGRDTPLRIGNVPKWGRMREFALRLRDALRGEGFEIPCVHEHSTCILLARRQLFFDDASKRWQTHIDFDKFNELVSKDPMAKSWSFMDYKAETPDWALLPQEGVIPEGKAEGWSRLDDGTVIVDGGLGAHPEHVRKMTSKMKRARGIE